MSPKPKPPPTVPLGPALESSDEELDAAAEITPEDIARAQDTARRHGRGTELNRMLEATPDDA